MKKFLSRYSLKYVRSLVYMLQVSEYNISGFFGWAKRLRNFGKAEERKTLVKTPKAIILLIASWSFVVLFLVYIFHLILLSSKFISLLIILASFFLLPYLLLYELALCAFILNLIQLPIEKMIVSEAKTKLKNHKAFKIGIAGSFGKTTMKEILKTILEERKKVAATPENKNTPLSIAKFIGGLGGDEEVLIFEMGEYYEGDIKKLCRLVDPDLGIITGVNEAHLEKFKSLQKSANTIFELADFLRGKSGCKLYINGESKIAREKSKNYENIFVYGRNGINEWKAKDIHTNLAGTSFILKNNNKSVVARSKLLGFHQVGPLSAAAHIALSLGIKSENIEIGLRKTKPFAHRLELREEAGGITVIDDSYNGNPDGVKAAIDFLSQIKNKRRFFITPGLVEMGGKTEEVHKEIGKWLAKTQIEKVVLIKNSATPFIEKGLKENNYAGEIITANSAPEAFEAIPRYAISGDLFLFQNDWPDNYA
jgi:UDP-N-acetylmuramoyl-tripeptide--D-alanyl-D-alanine ligase